MKKVTFALSALAITATVGTAMAHSKALGTQYCVAYTLPSGPTGPRVAFPYDGTNQTTSNTCSLTVLAREIDPQDETPQFYGFQKTTLECPHSTGCEAIIANEL